MLILLVGHQPTDLCRNKLCLKHGLYLLGIFFRLNLIWVGFVGVRFVGEEGVGKFTSCIKLVKLC